LLTMYFDSQEEQANWYVRFKNSDFFIRQAIYSVHKDGQKSVSFLWEPDQEEIFCRAIIDALYTFFSTYHLEYKIRDVIRERYFYEDEDEISHISEMALLMWDGEAAYCGDQHLPEQLKKRIKDLLQEVVEQKIDFSFQSLWNFRLRDIQALLVSLVGLAIDEYKLEQDYQEFIAVLRGLIEERDSQVDEIHLVYREEFQFYNRYFEPISKQDILKAIDRKLMAENPMFIDSNTIAPLVSLAPKRIHIYTDDEDNRIIATLRKIFEERILLFRISYFHEQVKQVEERP
jgi:putative sporulation protein YtxC